MDENIKQSLKKTSTWLRALYMIMFLIIYWVAEIIIGLVILFQFFSVLFTGKRNERLLGLGQSLSTFIYQIMVYLTFNSEARPYPVADWPTGTPSENMLAEPVEEATAEQAPAESSDAEQTPAENSVKDSDEKSS